MVRSAQAGKTNSVIVDEQMCMHERVVLHLPAAMEDLWLPVLRRRAAGFRACDGTYDTR